MENQKGVRMKAIIKTTNKGDFEINGNDAEVVLKYQSPFGGFTIKSWDEMNGEQRRGLNQMIDDYEGIVKKHKLLQYGVAYSFDQMKEFKAA